MTYSKSLQGYFVSGLYTPVLLLVAALAVWVIPPFFCDVPQQQFLGGTIGHIFSVVLSLLFYVLSSFLLYGLNIIERRVRWMPSMFVWLTAVYCSVECNVSNAFATLLFVASLFMLMSCQQSPDRARSLYSAFAMVGLSALLQAEFLYLVPAFVLFLFIANIFSIQGLFAALLGLLTPFWLLFGSVYVCPSLSWLTYPFINGVDGIFNFGTFEFSLLAVAVIASLLLLLLPATVMFSTSSTPSKPLLRRRMLFILLLNMYMLILGFVLPSSVELFSSLALPGVAVMATYILSFKATKLSNCYFILVFLAWIALFVCSLCLKQ